MEIGQKFTFYSNGKHRKALFLQQIKDKIFCVICDDPLSEGVNIEIHESQVINDGQISMF